MFVAFPFPEVFFKDVEGLQLKNKRIDHLRWIPLKNLHVTIFFLGEVDSSRLDEIKNKIRQVVSASPPFNLEFEKVTVQKGRRSGMIWLRFLKDENFSSLSQQLGKSLEEYLLKPVAIRDPIPHVTVARWKGSFDAENINAEFVVDFRLPEINFCVLCQTLHIPGGVRYESLERFEMGK